MTNATILEPVEIIKRLGGNASAARFFGVTKGAVSQWLTNGIPNDKVTILRLSRPEIFQKRNPRKASTLPP